MATKYLGTFPELHLPFKRGLELLRVLPAKEHDPRLLLPPFSLGAPASRIGHWC